MGINHLTYHVRVHLAGAIIYNNHYSVHETVNLFTVMGHEHNYYNYNVHNYNNIIIIV